MVTDSTSGSSKKDKERPAMRMRTLLELQDEFDRAFREARAWREAPATAASFDPPTDISRTADSYLVRLDLPGVSRDELRVYAEHGSLHLAGRKRLPDRQKGRVLRGERQSGPFTRTVALPSDADVRTVTARLRDGVLTVQVGRVGPQASGPVEVPVEG